VIDFRWVFAFVAVFASSLVSRAADPPPTVPAQSLKAAFDADTRHGFRLMVSKRLASPGPVVRHLNDRLADVVRAVPPAYLDILRDVTIWVEAGEDKAGRLPASVVNEALGFYIPLDMGRSTSPLPPEANGGIVVVADHLLDRERRWVYEYDRGWLLHEMAHALHDRLLGSNDAMVRAAYQQAVDRKLYDTVEKRFPIDLGQIRVEQGPAYARADRFEYFAELSEAYFNLAHRCYPFTRDDLANHDPAGFALMTSVWRPIKFRVVNDFLYGVTVERRSQCGRRSRLLDLQPGTEREFDGWEGMTLVATNMGFGPEMWVEKPEKDGTTWRLNGSTTGPMPASPWSLLLPKQSGEKGRH
jgi:hypothetical protein